MKECGMKKMDINPAMKTYSIKPLSWFSDKDPHAYGVFENFYQIYEEQGNEYLLEFHEGNVLDHVSRFTTLEAAKEAANEHHVKQMEEHLVKRNDHIIKGKIELQRSDDDQCICCKGNHVYSTYIKLEEFKPKYPNIYPGEIDNWLRSMINFKDHEGEVIEISARITQPPTDTENK